MPTEQFSASHVTRPRQDRSLDLIYNTATRADMRTADFQAATLILCL